MLGYRPTIASIQPKPRSRIWPARTLKPGFVVPAEYKSPRIPSKVHAVGKYAKKFGCCQCVRPVICVMSRINAPGTFRCIRAHLGQSASDNHLRYPENSLQSQGHLLKRNTTGSMVSCSRCMICIFTWNEIPEVSRSYLGHDWSLLERIVILAYPIDGLVACLPKPATYIVRALPKDNSMRRTPRCP